MRTVAQWPRGDSREVGAHQGNCPLRGNRRFGASVGHRKLKGDLQLPMPCSGGDLYIVCPQHLGGSYMHAVTHRVFVRVP